MENTRDNAVMFIENKDREIGEAWSNDTESMSKIFVEYAESVYVSRQLSAVPSEEWRKIFREIWDIGNELAGADNPEDFFEIEFEKWKTKRGIAG